MDKTRLSEVEEISGHGIRAVIDGRAVLAGNAKLMAQAGVECHPCEFTGTIVHVAADGRYLGHIVISDEVKEDAAETIAA